MAKHWHYAKGGKKYGPVTTAKLKELVETGRLSSSDLVRREDTAKWRKAGSVEGLFPASSAQPPDLPPKPIDTSNFPAKTRANTSLVIIGIAAAGVFMQMVLCCGVLGVVGEEDDSEESSNSSSAFTDHSKPDTGDLFDFGFGGRELDVQVGTATDQPWWIESKYNPSLKAVRGYATDNEIVIEFNVDRSRWQELKANWIFPLLVRVFDGNGNYLIHFVTAEQFTALPSSYKSHQDSYKRSKHRLPRPILLQPGGNRIAYQINTRDLEHAALIEIGFVQDR